MFANFIPQPVEYIRYLPEILLTVMGTVIMLIEAMTGGRDKTFIGNIAFMSILGAIGAALLANGSAGLAFQNMVIVDGFTTYFRVLVFVVGLLAVLCSQEYLSRENHNQGEFWALLLFCLAGQSVMVSSNELIMIFIGLEISSIASYVLAGYLRDDKRNNEAALKYFLLGSFATAFLLYGIAWIYGLTGVTNLSEIRAAIEKTQPSVAGLGVCAALMLVGFSFKVSAFPFQVWAPDVYQGAPAPVSAFLSAGPKAAAFAIFLRVFNTAFSPIADLWMPILGFCALATMIVGNFGALSQTNVKRLLAYSSIAHAGYVLVAIVAHSAVGTAAAMFYLAGYAFMNIGAFAVVTHVAGKGEQRVDVDDLAGLSVRQPGTAALLAIFLFSLIGVPLTGGFLGKFYIFKAALDSNLIGLTILGLLNSAVAAYYYLRIIVVMYMHDPKETGELPALGIGLKAALWVSALATFWLGIFPSVVLDFASKSAETIK